jgi:hypothetical protein
MHIRTSSADMSNDHYAPLTPKEHDELRFIFKHGLKNMFILGRQDHRSDIDAMTHVDSQEYDYADNNRFIYRLFEKYKDYEDEVHDFRATFQFVALECVNERFPDMDFDEVDFPLLHHDPDEDSWEMEIFFLSTAFGNSDEITDRHNLAADSCCFIITNRIERVQDPRSLSMINLAFVNPEYTAARYRRGRF